MILTKTEEVTEEQEKFLGYKCDKCKKEYLVDNPKNTFEFQEFHHIDFYGGYGSVMGDECRIRANICQYCLKELISDFCVYGDDNDD